MRRVGVKREHPEPSNNLRDLTASPPVPKRARLSTNIRTRSTKGVFRSVIDWFSSAMSRICRKVFTGWRRNEESDSDDSPSPGPSSPIVVDDQDPSWLPASAPPRHLTSTSHTSLPGTVTQPSHSLTTVPLTEPSTTERPPNSFMPAPHYSSTPHHSPTRTHHSSKKPLLKQTPQTATNPLGKVRTTSSLPPLVTHSHGPLSSRSHITPSIRSRITSSAMTTPAFSSTPYTSSKLYRPRSGSGDVILHNQGSRESADSPRYTQLLPDVTFSIHAPATTSLGSTHSTTGLKSHQTHKAASPSPPPENIGPVSPSPEPPPTTSISTTMSSKVAEMQEWFRNLLTTRQESNSDHQAEVELVQSRLRACRAERMEIENGRITRLRSLLHSPRVPEAPVKLNFELSEEEMCKVTMATRRGPSGEAVSNAFNISITRVDLGSLVGLNWLNDNVVNFYFNLIKAAHPKVHVMSSFFYPKLSQSGYVSVRRWTKKVDIFEMDLVLFPIHLGMHWCLAAADFRNSTLSYYDSLSGNNHACLSRLKTYLEDESESKKGVRCDLSSWKITICKDIPQQDNGSDCGVFMCMYARHLAQGLPFNFNQNDCPSIRPHMIYEILEMKLL